MSKKGEKISANVASKISAAMAMYLDSDDAPVASNKSSNMAHTNDLPPAPVVRAQQAGASGKAKKKSKLVDPTKGGGGQTGQVDPHSAATHTAPAYSSGSQSGNTQYVKQTAPAPSHTVPAVAPPAPPQSGEGYVAPSYLRKNKNISRESLGSSQLGEYTEGHHEGHPSGVREAPLSPDKTEIAGSRLYVRAKQQQKSLHDRQADKPYKCTFVPKFETSNKSRGSTSRPTGQFKKGMTESASGQERFDCLYRNAQAITEKKQRTIRRRETNPEGCTFAPKFEAKKKKKQGETTGLDRLNNLYSDGKKIKAKLEMMKAEEVVPGFSPQITRKAKKVNEYRTDKTKDYAQRLYRDERSTGNKYAMLEQKQKNMQLEGCTFTPSLKTKTKRSSSAPKMRASWATNDTAGVTDRLYKYNAKTTAKKARLLEKQEEQLKRETPFKPQLETSHYNKHRVSSGKKFDVDRLMNQGGTQEKTAKREALLRAEAKKLTFQPKIPKRRATSAPKTRPTWMSEKTAKREALLRAEAKKLTFQPKIPKRRATSAPKTRPTWMSVGGGEESAVLSGGGGGGEVVGTPVHMRLYDARSKVEETYMHLREESFMKEMRDCTFSPSIPLKKHEKTKISSHTPVWERLYDDRMSIAILREEIKAQKELTGCTFQPTGNATSHHRLTRGAELLVHKPLLERLAVSKDDYGRKLTLLEERKAELELRESTFQPNLSGAKTDKILKKGGIDKQRAAGKGVYERLHEEAKMQKIILENKKRAFDKQVMAECTFMPEVGVSLDDDTSVVSSSSLRIEKLAEPKSVNDKRFNLQHNKLEEEKRRPSGGKLTTGSKPTAMVKEASNVVNEIITSMANISSIGGGGFGQ
ncbi:hypothetical protein TL16_g03609 [Triparma laevis f. inornata]|uniref:Uncharacterized protein n=1 Tax=Triparma laevis f. inornata TaxID=1714386 RepID=A0A9W7E2M8_9STRA|nr:hypothetical protein TL16_g03609 [Triparma laevis f. inornata]